MTYVIKLEFLEMKCSFYTQITLYQKCHGNKIGQKIASYCIYETEKWKN